MGSSMISTSASSDSALAISTICRCATESGPHERSRCDVDPEPVEAALRIGAQTRPVDEYPTARFTREKDVLRHRQVRHQVELLMNDRDACGLGFERRSETAFAALVDDGAIVGRVLAADDLHQRRFARAVFSAHGMNLGTPQVETDAVQCDDAREALGHAREPQQLAVLVGP